MDLHIFSKLLEFKGTIDTTHSIRWRAQVFDAGELAITLPANEHNLPLITGENIVIRDDNDDDFGYFEDFVITDSTADGETASITGGLGVSILSHAICAGNYNFNGNVEAAMRTLVSENAYRAHANIELGDLNNFTETIAAQINYKNLLTALDALSKASGILFRIRPDVDRKVFIFETFKGTDRTIEQTATPRVAFSDLDETLDCPTYTEARQSYKNFAYVLGVEDDDGSRDTVTVDRVGSETRREVTVDASSLSKDDLTNAEYLAQLATAGGEVLDELCITQSFSSTISANNPYQYRTDYALGDLVTTHKDSWGIIISDRITEVEEVFDTSTGDVGEVTPTFGSALLETFTI